MSNSNNGTFPNDELPSVVDLQAEQERLKQSAALEDMFKRPIAEIRTDLEEAFCELSRELGVRERCFPNWIAVGKVSRVDAKDRYSRMKKALEICSYLLDITGRQQRTTADDVPF